MLDGTPADEVPVELRDSDHGHAESVHRYQALLRAAEAKEFDALVIDDLSRLSRDQVESERTIRRLEFSGLRLIAISDGYDSTSKSRKIQRGVKGLS